MIVAEKILIGPFALGSIIHIYILMVVSLKNFILLIVPKFGFRGTHLQTNCSKSINNLVVKGSIHISTEKIVKGNAAEKYEAK